MCDSIVARGGRTAEGKTLFAKNSDRRGREIQPFVQFPAAYHAHGSKVRCTHVSIDQVAETYRLMGHSPHWCWGFEQGVNEYGVAIGNQATASREPPESVPGLIGPDLVRLGLERGRNAREALEVIALLIESHGQGGSAFAMEGDGGYQNSFAIADGTSAWVLETTGRGWVAKEVEGASLTNALSLGADWQIGSRDVESAAIEQGFFERGERLDFCAAYTREDAPDFLTAKRRQSAQSCLAETQLSTDSLMAWLRNHGDGIAPPASSLELTDASRYSVCMHADPISSTTASLVVELPRVLGRRPWPVWVSFATPCTGLFLPVYLDGVLPPALASAIDQGSVNARESIWCLMRATQESAAGDFSRSLPALQSRWSELAETIDARRHQTETQVAESFAAGNRQAGSAELSAFMTWAVDRTFDVGIEILDSI